MPSYTQQDVNPFYKGCTTAELSRLFQVPLQTVKDNIGDLIPSGKRGNSDVYSIKDAASRILRSDEDDPEMVRRILRMNHTALPKMVSKEFWLAETHRQKYMITAGELWPTSKVVAWLSEAFKAVRLALMLLPDAVDREEALTNKQRDVIVTAVDATLNDAADRLVNEFANGRDPTSYEATSSEENGDDAEL